MTGLRQILTLVPLVVIAGCGGGAPDLSNPGTPPPHGGTLTPLPGQTGFVEVVRGSGGGPEFSFYFLKDMETPYSPAPSQGTLNAGPKKQIELKADGDHLVTPTGPVLFPSGEPDGELKVTLDGKPVVVPLNVR